MVKISKLMILLLILLTICVISQPVKADTSIYVFDPNQSTVVQTGGFAGVDETYPIEGYFQLSVDIDTGFASFEKVDANMLEPSGFLYTENLGVLFNMTELTGTIIDDKIIEFEGKTADGTESDVSLKLSFRNDSANLTGKTTPPPNSADMFFYDINAVAIKKYAGGTGEPNNPYQIATAEELMLLGDSPEDYDKHFILTADIDLDPNLPGRKVFDRAVIAQDTNDTESGLQGIPFTGVFDGNGHIISHLTIMGERDLGLFGQLGSAADVKDLGIKDANIVGTDCLGSLAAINKGSINTCYSTGIVIGNEDIGGLVGSNGGNITMCYSTGAITGGRAIGGLVGHNNNGNITGSYSASLVIGNIAVGGLVGGNGGSFGGNITTCYSNGEVSGDQYVGGLVGINDFEADGGVIANSYSTGMVTGNKYVGGLVGYNSWLGSINSGLWDVETSGQTTSDGGVGKTTFEMQDPNTFIAVGWDFLNRPDGPHDIWIEPEGGGYPLLWWQFPSGFVLPVFAGGKGEPNDPYLISTAEQLNTIGHNPKLMISYFKLIDNLDVTDLHFYPIGSPDYPYRGVFDGNGHTISNLMIEGVSYLGLFSVIGDGAEVKDLGLVDVNISGSNGNVGGLVGLNWGSTVTNCFSTGTVRGGDWYVGGLVGYNDNGSITGSYSDGSITGDNDVGGLVGYNDNGSITGSYSTGTVTGGDWDIGGLVGTHSGIITASYSTCTVTGTSYHVGGFVGKNADRNSSGTITYCYSTGAVNGSRDVGGLVGLNAYSWEDGTITNCYSTGIVTGYTDVGGLVGSNGGNIITCYSIGTVNGDSHVGGLVGDNTSSITTSYSTGVVSGRGNVGGLVGKNWSSIAKSYSTGTVSGNENVGGLVGYSSWGRIAMSYSAGTVRGNINVGGLVGQDRGEVVVTTCFWDIETSGQITSAGGTGHTTVEMQTSVTFLDAGWDFADETANGTEDIWWILEGQDYPRLWWENLE